MICRFEEVLPHRSLRRECELLVVEGNVDAGLERRVKCLYAVGGEKHGAFVVFEDSEEDGDEFVSF